jgi:hypothetical protein|nr:MAG TPA: hypothetical protein [Caudoviricetes sp.]
MIGGAKGIGIGIDFGIPNQYCRATSKPYIEKDVLDSLRVVASAYGKSNDDADRSIVKNLVDASNPFIISNAAYEGMSGYNGYPVVFGANKTWAKESNGYVTSITSNTIHITNVLTAGLSLLYSYVKYNGNLQNIKEIPPFKIEIKGLEGRSKFIYKYLATSDATKDTNLYLGNGTHELPKSFLPTEALINDAVVGFSISPIEEGVTNFLSDITIKVLPEYEGAFVTDGIDDLITSTKTVQEMLGGSNELTIVSMVHQVKDSANNVSFTNYIRGSANGYFRNIVNNYDKTGIYGYTSSDLMGLSVVNNILGDKNDYTSNGDNRDSIINGNFSVQGYSYNDGNNTGDFSSVAWYWTIIANKVLTTDEINQVIAYYNLDRTLNPDILCNTIKQGITNENHAEFGDKLIDFSGNGRDIQLNNIAWKGDSGIGKYEVDFLDSSIWNSSNSTITSSKIDCKNAISHIMLLYYSVGSKEYPDIPSFKIIKTGADIDYSYIDKTGSPKSVKIVDGENVLPASHNTLYSGSGRFCGFGNPGMGNSVTITQIPSHAGALCLDGINDFGKVTGVPVYKDYTIIADYERFYLEPLTGGRASILSKSSKVGDGSFIFNLEDQNGGKSCYTFGEANGNISDDITRIIRYQSKYYNTKTLSIGTAEDNDFMVLGKVREVDSRYFYGAIYSLMSFPYSMSEFLIDRQLKKHKLGTLYPDMVEWRPIIKSNVEYASISYLLRIPGQGTVTPVIGQYYPILSTDTSLVVYVATNGVDEVANLTINGQEPTSSSIHVDGRFKFEFPFNNSPQKINITIDEYIRYEDIVQPYPSLFTLIDYDTEEVYSWGSKLKVGTKFKGNVINLLPNMYEWQGNALYNGEILNWGVKPGVVAKEMVFSWDMPFKYLIDNNEPKVILSPKLLSMPNSSYKILGYIPDISGHGNNGVIHNSAYVEGSGVNEDGSYQFDGVDDFVTIPTLSRGGKQVLMKVNWNTSNDAILYDQRNFEEGGNFSALFAVMTSNSDSILAYSGRNTDGKTYIDGILNANITCGQLLNITHNITALAADNRPLGKGGVVIGASKMPAAYCKAAVYDFMLFDNISTDDKIKELNEYVGIEAKVELPPYYWDAYGKTNSDADKDTIQQRGIAVGDYDLTNTNFAYDKMSGFGGYTLGKFTNSWSLSNNSNSISIVARNPYDITLKKLGENRDWEFKTTELKIISNPVSVKFKSDKNIRLTCDYHYYTVGGNSEGAPLRITSKDLIANEDTIITISPISQENIDKYNIDINRGYYLIYFQLSLTLAVNEEVTIEMLPLYPNGLVYDGVEDFSDNKNVPLIDDFTVIAKRTWLEENTSDKPFIIKGDTLYPDGNKNAFLFEYGKLSTYSFGQNNKYDESVVPSLISWATPTSYNGTTSLVRGSAIDTVGIDIAHATKIVLYKLILYPKTIPLLQINFLKNLMEKNEIIDLNNPIFIQ